MIELRKSVSEKKSVFEALPIGLHSEGIYFGNELRLQIYFGAYPLVSKLITLKVFILQNNLYGVFGFR